tara:strand:+ start:305 stop:841 length:537 start_codon:yes stop_codon:yes gene_type:complete
VNSVVLIERDPPSYASWPSLIQKKKIPELSVQEVVSKYQGFEGELICFSEIKDNATGFRKKLDECLQLKILGGCFLLYIISNPDNIPSFLKAQATKLGYDVGVCEEEKTIYSSIFHEVIFGYFDELIIYKKFLNENLLFPSKVVAKEYVKLHDELSVQGKGVEDYEAMTIYEIWEHKN